MSSHNPAKTACPPASRTTPERSCAATGEKGSPASFLRFVQGPQNDQGHTAPWPDLGQKLPGRGLYLTPTEVAYKLALKKRVFAHHLDTNQPPQPWPELAELLQKDALQRLGLAKKAGQLILGLDNVLEAGRQPVLKGILLAADTGADAHSKASKLASRLALPLLVHFSKAQLEQALGQPNVAVVGLSRLDTAWPAVHKASQAVNAGS